MNAALLAVCLLTAMLVGTPLALLVADHFHPGLLNDISIDIDCEEQT